MAAGFQRPAAGQAVKKLWVSLSLAAALVSCARQTVYSEVEPALIQSLSGPETLIVYSFNIQIFGTAKMAKPEVLTILLDIVSRADVTAVQEVRSIGAGPVSAFMEALPERYACILGPREGRSGSKEQYWIIYDASKLTVLADHTWPDPEDIFERNPLGVYFQTRGSFDFILINNHIRPSNAAAEIAALPAAAAYFRELWDEPDVIIAGDLNADGVYYDETFLADIFADNEYTIIIPNTLDTTVAESDNTYDRIIITTSAAEDFTGRFGVVRFDRLYDFSALSISPAQVSDHYPVWAEFWLDADTD